MANNNKEYSSNSISNLLINTNNITSFSSLNAFPKIIETIDYKAEKEKRVNEINNIVNHLDIYSIMEKLKTSNKLGRLSIEKNDDIETGIFINGNFNESTEFKIVKLIKDDDKESINLVHMDKERKNALSITTNNSEFLYNMFSIVFGADMDIEYNDFVLSNLIDKTKETNAHLFEPIVNKSNETNVLINDSIYNVLSTIGTESQNKIFVDEIGVFFVANGNWKIIGSELNIKTEEELFNVLVSIKKNNDANYHNYNNISDDSLILKEQYNLFLENRKIEEAIKLNEIEEGEKSVVVEETKQTEIINTNDSIDVEISDSYTGYETDMQEYYSNNEFIDVEYADIYIDNDLNNNNILETKNKLSPIISNEQLNIINEKQIDKNEKELYNDNNTNIEENKSEITMIDELNKLNEKISIEDFFHYAVKNDDFQIKTEIHTHNDNCFFRLKKYAFTNKINNNKIVVSLLENQWFFDNKGKSGVGLTTLMTELFNQVYESSKATQTSEVINKIDFSEKSAKLFVVYINNNIDGLIELSNKRKKSMEFLLSKSNNDSLHNISGEENVFKLSSVIEKYAKYYPFILDIDSIDIVERVGNKHPEIVSLGKTYRLNGMDWYCINDRNVGVGIKSLIDYIYVDYDDEYKKNKLNSYKYMVKNISEHLFINSKENNDLIANNIEESTNSISSNNNEIKDTISAMQLSKINTNEIKDDFNELANINANELIEKSNILDIFTIEDIINVSLNNEKSTTTERPYKMFKSNNGEIMCGKIHVLDGMTLIDLINNISETYGIDNNTELLRVSNVLKEMLITKTKNELKEKLNEYNENLVQSKLDEIKDSSPIIEESGVKVVTKTREEEYNDLIGLSEKKLLEPVKANLYNYYTAINGQFVTFNLKALFNRLSKANEVLKNIEIEQKEFSDMGIFKLKSPSFEIKVTLDKNSEHWELVNSDDKRNLSDNGTSVVDLIKELHNYYSISFKDFNFNRYIGDIKENNFLANFPKDELLEKMGATKNNSNYDYKGMSVGVKIEDNIFSIWSNNAASGRSSSIELMQYLLAKDNGVSLDRADINKNTDTSWVTAKKRLKKEYLSLNSYEINLTMNKSVNPNAISSEDKFIKMLPKPNLNSKQLEHYLIIERGINPDMVHELNNSYFYEGLYDFEKKSLFTNYNDDDKEIQLAPVVVFSNESCASVRGCVESSKNIKETVPGSSLEILYSIPESQKYVYTNPDNKDFHIVFNEAAIDSLSYRCLFPKSRTFSLFGINTKPIIGAIDELYKMNDFVKIVYALDNTGLDENNEPYDKASRKALFNLQKDISEKCYDNFEKTYIEDTENKNLVNNELLSDIVEFLKTKFDRVKLNETQLDLVEKAMLKISEHNENNTIETNNVHLKKELGKLLFKFEFIDTNRFIVRTPKHEKYGVFKDWNDMLVSVVNTKQKEDPNKSLTDIHEEIIFEFNPNLKHNPKFKKDVKKENLLQMKLV